MVFRRTICGIKAVPQMAVYLISFSMILFTLFSLMPYRGVPISATAFYFLQLTRSYTTRLIWMIPSVLLSSYSVRENGHREAFRSRIRSQQVEVHSMILESLTWFSITFLLYSILVILFGVINQIYHYYPGGYALLNYPQNPEKLYIWGVECFLSYMWGGAYILLFIILFHIFRQSAIAFPILLMIMIVDCEFYNIVLFSPNGLTLNENSSLIDIWGNIRSMHTITHTLLYWTFIAGGEYTAILLLCKKSQNRRSRKV